MRSQTELAATFYQAMREKNINRQQLTNLLQVHPTMTEKLLCGEVIPSRHLQQRMVEVLGLPREQVTQLASRCERQIKAGMARETEGRKAA